MQKFKNIRRLDWSNFSEVQHNTTQHNTIQHNTTQHNTVNYGN